MPIHFRDVRQFTPVVVVVVVVVVAVVVVVGRIPTPEKHRTAKGAGGGKLAERRQGGGETAIYGKQVLEKS